MKRSQPLKRKTPLKRSTKPLKRSRPKPVGSKRKEQLKTYNELLRPAQLVVHPNCQLGPAIQAFREAGGQAQWWPICTKKATEVHHTEGRENELLLKVKSFLSGCRNCHRWATDHSSQAIEIGISKSRHKINDNEQQQTL